ncbi:tudor domain-containing 6-like [Brachyistius frenatus]|uniref:tudor domain-containing 6-like n=1 Tax=Brachyistius frenatus TaxID=100188 RepID=UPI0037E811B1
MMCSIPGLPMSGSEVPVLITRVNLNPGCGLVELWVNMDKGRKHVYEQMREKIQTPKRRFNGSEGKSADLCLVCFSDAWHRARIVSVQSETYEVFLIDQGQLHVATSEALAWGHTDNFLLPPEIESGVLANVVSVEEKWSERAEKFLMSLPGKKSQGLVQQVLMPDRTILLEIPAVSKHLCQIGVMKTIPVDEFKSLALKCLHKEESPDVVRLSQELNLNDQYFYPELLPDGFETVHVTEVTDPLNIFCKILIFSRALEILSEQIQQHYEESGDLGEARPQTVAGPCAARGTDGRWRRSLLKQNTATSDGAVEVLHVDEGKTKVVPVGDVRPLLGKFLRMPVVTYVCALTGVKRTGREWTADETDYLKSLLLNQTFVAKFDHHNMSEDVYDATLCAADDTCINDCFIKKAGLTPPSKPEGDGLNEPVLSSLLSSLGDKGCTEVKETKKQVVDGKTDNVALSGADDSHTKAHSKHQDPLKHIYNRLPPGLPCEVLHACDDGVFAAGNRVNVNVSCIESLQKFWCQTTEHCDSLRRLMQDLQNHYTSAQAQLLVESICVARNPDNSVWYRARIIASRHSTAVDVRFIDYGQSRKVPLRDVCPIDPSFLQLDALAFQCCLFNPKTDPTAATWTHSALTEFKKFVGSGASSNTGLKCIIKAVTCNNEEGPVNSVDIEAATGSACTLLAQKCAPSEAQVPLDAYTYSTFNIEVGGKEKVWVTSSETVDHFYCQLDRNSPLFDKLKENVAQLLNQPPCSNLPPGLNSICFARYTDNEWYRGQVVEMSPELKVHFVDYGDTLAVKEADLRPFPSDASIARSVPVQAVLLALIDVPAEVPREVNRWFAEEAIGQSFTISVAAKGEKGKLIVQLMFNDSVNVNEAVRERMAGLVQQQPDSSKSTYQDCRKKELKKASALTKTMEQHGVHSSDRMCAEDELQMSSIASEQETEHVKTLDEGRTLEVIPKENGTVAKDGHIDSEIKLPSLPRKVNISMYKRPNISQSKTEVYASCIVGPHYFWCQYTDTKDLNTVSKLAQEAGWAEQDGTFPETPQPGSPCLALFSSDNQWYRAQAIRRADDTLHVLFVDYGNESEVDIVNVRSLPQSLLEFPPQAFLCFLDGFDESKGSWDDEVYDDFYNRLVDKQLKMTVCKIEDHSEAAVPQYTVKTECDEVVINDLMQKYWKASSSEPSKKVMEQTETLLQAVQTKDNTTKSDVSKGINNTDSYRKPEISKDTSVMVYASCIVEPHFFWCQHADTEDLCKVVQLAQEAGQVESDLMFPETLHPGSPCLALFSGDNQWYRAQVIRREDDTLHVVFIDYGNESNVGVKDVRALPQSLLETPPQAFLCCLKGFDGSKGSWKDEVYDDFYSLLVDKLLKLTVFRLESSHSEMEVPQYSVEIEGDGAVVNSLMQKHWTGLDSDDTSAGRLESVDQKETRTIDESIGG